MTQKEKMIALAAELRRLSNLKTLNKEELNSWYAAANDLRKKIEDDKELQAVIPHFFWHYISDADIRLKDSRYEEMQSEKLLQMIHALEKGEIPFGGQ
jgi:hypothetical protein